LGKKGKIKEDAFLGNEVSFTLSENVNTQVIDYILITNFDALMIIYS